MASPRTNVLEKEVVQFGGQERSKVNTWKPNVFKTFARRMEIMYSEICL